MKKAAIVVMVGVLLGTTSALAQSTRNQNDATKAFIERKQSAQSAYNKGSPSPNELRDLNGLVRAVNVVLPEPAVVQDDQQREAIRSLFLVDVAQTLDRNGVKPGALRSSADKGAALVNAAGNVLRGTASLDEQILLADTVFIGEVSAINPAAPMNDEHLTTVSLKVVQPLKMAPGLRGDVDLRRRSGRDGQRRLEVSTEAELTPGQRVLVVASRSRYTADFAPKGASCRQCIVENIPVLLVEGQTARSSAGDAYQIDIAKLASIK